MQNFPFLMQTRRLATSFEGLNVLFLNRLASLELQSDAKSVAHA